MIREFEQDDLEKFVPNEFSDPAGVTHVFTDDGWWNYTLENDGIKAIICFLENEPNDWAGFFLISKYFTPRDGVKIKEFINMVVGKLKKDEPARLWTISKPHPVIEAWLKWLGMEIGTPREINGVIYNEWAIHYE